MKTIKKLAAIFLVAAMVLSLGIVAFAETPSTPVKLTGAPFGFYYETNTVKLSIVTPGDTSSYPLGTVFSFESDKPVTTPTNFREDDHPNTAVAMFVDGEQVGSSLKTTAGLTKYFESVTLEKVGQYTITFALADAPKTVLFTYEVTIVPSEYSINITNPTGGTTYTYYKLLDATFNGETGEKKSVSYSTDKKNIADFLKAAQNSSKTALFTVGTTSPYSVTLNDGITEAEVIEFFNTMDSKDETKNVLVELLKTEGVATDSKTAAPTDNRIVLKPSSYGYYVIVNSRTDEDETVTSALTIDTNTPYVEVIDKLATEPSAPIPDEGDPDETNPTRMKYIDEDDAVIGVGGTAKTVVQFNTTNFKTETVEDEVKSTQITKYVISDTMTNMTMKDGTFKVTVDDVDVTVKKATNNAEKVGNWYTYDEATGALVVSIDWVDKKGESLYASPAKLALNYTVTVSGSAAGSSATNTANVQYYLKGVEEPVNMEVKDNSNTVELTNRTLTIDADPTGGSYTLDGVDLVKDNDIYRPFDPKTDNAGDIVESIPGDAVISGLDNKSYTVNEVNPPDGYNPLGSATADLTNSDNKAEFKYQKGTLLPTTGAAGTTMLIVFGSILFMATALVLVTKKRMYNEGI